MNSNTRNTLITAHDIALKYGVADNIEWKPKEEENDISK